MDASNSVCRYLVEDEGKIIYTGNELPHEYKIRPIRPIDVGRMEKDTDKLRALYQEGYDIAQRLIISAHG